MGEPLWPRLHRQPVFYDWYRHVCLLRRLSSRRNHQQVRPGKAVQITRTHPILAKVVSQRTDKKERKKNHYYSFIYQALTV